MKQLGINPAMDELAREKGLRHWSCTDPFYAQTWVRSDGIIKWIDDAKPYDDTDNRWTDFAIKRLKLADKCNPIGKDWQQPTPIIRENPLSAIQDMLSTGIGVTNNQLFDAEMYGEIVKGIVDRVAQEKTIVSNGCHDCVFSLEINGYKNVCHLDYKIIMHMDVLNKTRHPQCPLLTGGIKVVKSDV